MQAALSASDTALKKRNPMVGATVCCPSAAGGVSVRLTARTTASPIRRNGHLVGTVGGESRPYGRTGLTYCTVVGCSGWEQSHMQKEAGRGERYHLRCA